MIATALTKALDDLLKIAGSDANFHPDIGPSFPLRVIYGKDPNLMQMGEFEARDYEHQFLCRSSDIPKSQRQAEIELNGRVYTIADMQIKEPAAILFGE